jgi:hypothetical protein
LPILAISVLWVKRRILDPALRKDSFALSRRGRAKLGKGPDKLAKTTRHEFALQPEEPIFQSTSAQFFPKK